MDLCLLGLACAVLASISTGSELYLSDFICQRGMLVGPRTVMQDSHHIAKVLGALPVVWHR